jgi:integrase
MHVRKLNILSVKGYLEVTEGDWKGLILSGYFTGGRRVDLARLTWSDIDLSEKTITFVQRKTGSSVQVPIHQDLYDCLLELPGSDRPKKPVFPKLFDEPGAGKSGLSMSFMTLMERVGIERWRGAQERRKPWAQCFTIIVPFAPTQLQFGNGQCRRSARDPPKADRPCEPGHE